MRAGVVDSTQLFGHAAGRKPLEAGEGGHYAQLSQSRLTDLTAMAQQKDPSTAMHCTGTKGAAPSSPVPHHWTKRREPKVKSCFAMNYGKQHILSTVAKP
jgi:hypothetical protein